LLSHTTVCRWRLHLRSFLRLLHRRPRLLRLHLSLLLHPWIRHTWNSPLIHLRLPHLPLPPWVRTTRTHTAAADTLKAHASLI